MRRLLPLLILLLVVLGQPAPTAAQSPTAELIQRINEFRASLNLPPFQTNQTLALAAQQQANYMAETNLYSHTGYNGSTPQSRANAVGYNGRVVENIVGGWRMTPQRGLTWWQNSPVHYNTITSTRYTQIGAGHAIASEQHYYAIVVGLPSGSPATTQTNSANDQPAPVQVVPIALAAPRTDGAIVHQVQPGQSLWMLAAHYEVDLTDLYAFNNLSENDWVNPGDEVYIRLPAGQVPPPTPTPPLTHIVQEGETPWNIAIRYDLSLQELLSINGLSQDVILQPGVEIRLRLLEGEAPPPTPTPPSTHQVAEGDTLLGIAVRYDVPLEDMLAWNQLADDALLQIGQTLVVRPPVTATPVVSVPIATARPLTPTPTAVISTIVPSPTLPISTQATPTKLTEAVSQAEIPAPPSSSNNTIILVLGILLVLASGFAFFILRRYLF